MKWKEGRGNKNLKKGDMLSEGVGALEKVGGRWGGGPSFAKGMETQILVIEKLNGRKYFILRIYFCL